MYRACLFCSADLGTNEMLEEFPVGQSLAFDGERGRLWAVCRRCSRWNLAPIEERWEALESAEKRFRDARLRVHSENIGLAKLPDGTRLIRVGEALAGELAAWRYGSQLVRRRRQYLWGMAGVAGLGVLAMGGLYAAGAIGVAGGAFNFGRMAWEKRQGKRLVYHVAATDSPTGSELWLRRFHLHGARLVREAGSAALLLPEAGVPERLVLTGAPAQAVLGRALVVANHRGARQRDVERATALLSGWGGSQAYLDALSTREAALGVPRLQFAGRRTSARAPIDWRTRWRHFTGTFRGEIMPYEKIAAAHATVLARSSSARRRKPADDSLNALEGAERLALEMALHEESERRALEGELWLLERAWREAEEIAAIADVLPDDPLDRIRPRMEKMEKEESA